jgi:ribosome modulation factor
MKQRRVSWLKQIVTIENKGYQAFLDGQPSSACPYQNGYRNQNGAGGGLQQQRRAAWWRGWYAASKKKDNT